MVQPASAAAVPGAALQPTGSTVELSRSPDGAVVRRTLLPGGLRVVTEQVPGMRSVAFGVWVAVGSCDETPELAGSSHFLEHLLFKGTDRRSALDIASAMDAVGGESNAFTSREYTCYYARVLDADLPLAVDVVCDMVTSSRVVPGDVDSERGVVLEEIAMRDDDPGDLVHDLFAETVFGDAPIGRPVLGTVESINGLSRDAVHGYYRRRYRPGSMVVAAAGSLDHDAVVQEVQAAFARTDVLSGDEQPDPPRLVSGRLPAVRPGALVHEDDTGQANLVLGTTGLSRHDERRYALGVLDAALGGGMSSRLFQSVREQRGLAYAVGSFTQQHADTGLVGVYAGCQPGKLEEVLDLCLVELDQARRDGITPAELERCKGQLKGSLVLGMEDNGSRMSRIGKGELVNGEVRTVDDVLARIEAVTLDDVAAVAADVLARPLSLAVVGPFAEGPLRSRLEGLPAGRAAA